MKIVIDARLYSPKYTGIGRYVYELLKELQQRDHENSYVVFLSPSEFEDFVCPNDRWVKKQVEIPHYSLKEQTTWYRILKEEQADLVYFPHFNVPVRYQDPFVVTIHDLTLHHYPYKEYTPKWSLKKQLQIWVYKWIMKMTVQHARHIVAISQNTKQDLLSTYRASEKKVSVVLEGVPEHFQTPSQDILKNVQEKYQIHAPYLLYTGVWRSHKNLLRLIEAFSLLVKEGRALQLVLTGKKDPAYPEIPSLIKKLGIEDQVILTGFVSEEELIALNAGAKVFVFPSLYEGFGLPPLEAMQFGVPVVCSDRASLPEVCGEAAEYCDPENITDIVQAISKVLDSQKHADKLIEKGFENLKRFSWKTMSRDILDILISICNNASQTKKIPQADPQR